MLIPLVACDGNDGEGGGAAAEAARNSITHTAAARPPGTNVDSLRPIEEELRMFREGLEAAELLEPAADSRDALVDMFMTALARQDTARFADLLLDRSEFAYLYYPETKFTAPPYRMAPGLLWYLTMESSRKGLVRALRRFGGKEIRLRGYTCAEKPERIGRSRVWTECLLDLVLPDGPRRIELFSGIIERDGRYKLIGYANDL